MPSHLREYKQSIAICIRGDTCLTIEQNTHEECMHIHMCELHISEELASMKMNSPTYTSSVYCSPLINGCLLTPLWPLAPQCYNQNIFMKSDQVEQKSFQEGCIRKAALHCPPPCLPTEEGSDKQSGVEEFSGGVHQKSCPALPSPLPTY